MKYLILIALIYALTNLFLSGLLIKALRGKLKGLDWLTLTLTLIFGTVVLIVRIVKHFKEKIVC